MATSSANRNMVGSSDYLTGTVSAANITTDRSTVGWVYIDSTTSWAGAFGNRLFAGGWGLIPYSGAGGHIHFAIWNGSGTESSLTTGTGSFRGMGVAQDQGTATDFIDINSITTTTDNVSTTASATTGSNTWTIGRAGPDNTDVFDGSVLHNQAFNRLISVNEMSCALLAPGSVTNGLVGYWPAYGGLSPEPDLSGGGNDMTVTGTMAARNEACRAIPQQQPIM